jgi:hypothetical protein
VVAYPYFGIANEPWGCGGNMRPEFYADLYRQYSTFVKNYDRTKPIYRHRGRRERRGLPVDRGADGKPARANGAGAWSWEDPACKATVRLCKETSALNPDGLSRVYLH